MANLHCISSVRSTTAWCEVKLIRRVTVIEEQVIEVTKEDMDLDPVALFQKYEEQITTTPFNEIELRDYEHYFLE